MTSPIVNTAFIPQFFSLDFQKEGFRGCTGAMIKECNQNRVVQKSGSIWLKPALLSIINNSLQNRRGGKTGFEVTPQRWEVNKLC